MSAHSLQTSLLSPLAYCTCGDWTAQLASDYVDAYCQHVAELPLPAAVAAVREHQKSDIGSRVAEPPLVPWTNRTDRAESSGGPGKPCHYCGAAPYSPCKDAQGQPVRRGNLCHLGRMPERLNDAALASEPPVSWIEAAAAWHKLAQRAHEDLEQLRTEAAAARKALTKADNLARVYRRTIADQQAVIDSIRRDIPQADELERLHTEAAAARKSELNYNRWAIRYRDERDQALRANRKARKLLAKAAKVEA
jgi:hypothetical protein